MNAPRLAAGFATAATLAVGAAGAQTPAPAFEIERYEVVLTPDFEARSISATTRIRVRSLSDGLAAVDFSGNALTVDAARVGGTEVAHGLADGRWRFDLPKPLRRGQTATLAVAYHGVPARGLTFGDGTVRTSYFACDWMFCDQDRPGDLAELDLRLVLPDGVAAAATGEPAGPRRWRLKRPTGAFLYGFAAGRFEEVRLPHARTDLRVLGESVAPAALATAFQDTGPMLDFFEAKAGVRYPGREFVQVAAPGGSAQEAAGMAVFGVDTVEALQAEPTEDWAIAHELAHQWWAALVGCESWEELWLNEGFATFMTAAWKEQRWGRAAYDREMALGRKRLDAARAEGWDRPLSWAGAYPSLRLKRAVHYSKAALFLDELRRTLGEQAFWAGVRGYTRANAGKTVTARDLQVAMEAASGRDLSGVFGTWAYPPSDVIPDRAQR